MTEPNTPAEIPSSRDPLILVVDDDPGALETFEQILRADGYRVRVAASAEVALQEVQRDRPAAILLDLHLPLADGLEFVRRCPATDPHARVPIAVVTGNYLVDEGVARELQSLGVRIHFKPLWEEDLVRLVRGLLAAA